MAYNERGQIAVTAIATYFGGPQAGAAAAWASYYTNYQAGDVGASLKAGAKTYDDVAQRLSAIRGMIQTGTFPR